MISIENMKIVFTDEVSEIEDIRRCLHVLYSTMEGDFPMNRNIGLNTDFLSMPIPTAKNMLALEIIRKTNEYEPRVTVKEITFQHDDNGMLSPTIKVGRRK